MLSCEFCETSKSTLFTEHLWGDRFWKFSDSEYEYIVDLLEKHRKNADLIMRL